MEILKILSTFSSFLQNAIDNSLNYPDQSSTTEEMGHSDAITESYTASQEFRRKILQDAFGDNKAHRPQWANESPLAYSPIGAFLSMAGCQPVLDLYVNDLMRPGTSANPPAEIANNEIVINHPPHFLPESGKLDPRFLSGLNKVIEILKEHPEIKKVEIKGFSGDTGNPSVNESISKTRAESVKTYFEKAGIDPIRLVAVGSGVSDSAEKIEIVILEKKN